MMPGFSATAAGELLGERSREPLDRPLARAIRRDLGRGRAAPRRAEVHDHAAPRRDHRGQEVADDVVRPLDVDVDEPREVVRRDLPQGRVLSDDRRVVDEQPGRTGLVQPLRRPGGDRSVVGHVDRCYMVRQAELFGDAGSRLAASAAAANRLAFRGELCGESAAKSTADAGDDDHEP